MDEPPEEMVEISVPDPETRMMLGMFDVPAFARRGADLEYGLNRLHDRCRRERLDRLEMVLLRLRQWSSVATGPHDWATAFDEPILPLLERVGFEPSQWAADAGSPRRQRNVANDLIASVERFNRRWSAFLNQLDLEPINALIERYNRYYLLEKECALGSTRIAAKLFRPRSPVTPAMLSNEFPSLPVPRPAAR